MTEPAADSESPTGRHDADMERFVEELYLSAYINHEELNDVQPGYEYAVQQLLSDLQARNPELLNKDIEVAARVRAQDRHGVTR